MIACRFYLQCFLCILVVNVEAVIPNSFPFTLNVSFVTVTKILILESPHQVYLRNDGIVTRDKVTSLCQVLSKIGIVFQKLRLHNKITNMVKLVIKKTF